MDNLLLIRLDNGYQTDSDQSGAAWIHMKLSKRVGEPLRLGNGSELSPTHRTSIY